MNVTASTKTYLVGERHFCMKGKNSNKEYRCEQKHILNHTGIQNKHTCTHYLTLKLNTGDTGVN